MGNNPMFVPKPSANARSHWQRDNGQEPYHWQAALQPLCGRARGSRMWSRRQERWGGDRKGHSVDTVHLLSCSMRIIKMNHIWLLQIETRSHCQLQNRKGCDVTSAQRLKFIISQVKVMKRFRLSGSLMIYSFQCAERIFIFYFLFAI